MKCLFFILLAGYAVRCDDNNYYVIEMPDEISRQKPFRVFWNVPTKQCKSKKIPFEDLYQKFGIFQNSEDHFVGEKIAIMYDPGLFPALFKEDSKGQFRFRNGGVPQQGDLERHLEQFRIDLNASIPNKDFKGVGIIDFESWRPIYRQNFGELRPYKEVSYEIEKNLHWWWTKSHLEAEAKRRFEDSATTFMHQTLLLARALRPAARWGFYGFPYCYNMAVNNMREECAANVPEENDRLSWLWRDSTALYPSLYSSSSLSNPQLAALIRGRLREANRCAKGTPVYPYFWFRYREGGFLRLNDLNTSLNTIYKSNVSGFIIWGSSSDVNTVDKCKKLYNYLNNVLGPAIVKYTIPVRKDEIGESEYTTEVNNYKLSHHFEGEVNTNGSYYIISPPNMTESIKSYNENKITKNIIEHEDKIQENTNILYADLLVKTLFNKNYVRKEFETTTSYMDSNESAEIDQVTHKTFYNGDAVEENDQGYTESNRFTTTMKVIDVFDDAETTTKTECMNCKKSDIEMYPNEDSRDTFPDKDSLTNKDHIVVRDTNPQNKDVSPKTEDVNLKNEYISPQNEYIDKKTKEVSPKIEIKNTISKTEDINAKIDEIIPKIEDTSPKIDEIILKNADVSPKIKDINSQNKNTISETEDINEKIDEIIPKIEDTNPKIDEMILKNADIPKIQDTSPKIEDISPKTEGISLKTEDINLQNKNISPQIEVITSKNEETSPQNEDTSLKTEDTSRKDSVTEISVAEIESRFKDMTNALKGLNLMFSMSKSDDLSKNAKKVTKQEIYEEGFIDTTPLYDDLESKDKQTLDKKYIQLSNSKENINTATENLNINNEEDYVESVFLMDLPNDENKTESFTEVSTAATSREQVVVYVL